MELRFLIAFLLFSIGLNAQIYQTNTAPYEYTRGLKADTILVIPRGVDTPAIGNNKFGKPSIGAIFYRSTDSTLWLRSATRWNKTSIVDSFYYTISQLTDTSAAIYRSDGIVDTLAITTGDVSISFDSTSLSNRINLKLNISDTAAMLSPYIRYAYRTPGVDSIYFVQGSGAIIAVKDSAGGGGIGGTLVTDRLVFSANGEVKDTSTLVYSRSTGSVGIGGTPDASAQLDVSSTTKGFLPPRMTTAQRDAIASPASGLVVYNTTEKVPQFWNDSSWQGVVDNPGVDGLSFFGSSVKYWSYGGSGVVPAAQSIVDGVQIMIAVYVRNITTITGVIWWQHTQGVYTADNYNGIALYSQNAGALQMLAMSTNDGGIWKAPVGWAKKEFSTPIMVKPGMYYIAALRNSSAQTTSPAIGTSGALFDGRAASLDFSNGNKYSSTRTGRSQLDTDGTQMSNYLNSAVVWLFGLY